MSISAYTPLYLIDVTAEDVVVDDDIAEDVFDEDVTAEDVDWGFYPLAFNVDDDTDTEEELELTFGYNKSYVK